MKAINKFIKNSEIHTILRVSSGLSTWNIDCKCSWISDEIAIVPDPILPPPISVADALLSSITPLHPTGAKIPEPPPLNDDAAELIQLQSIAVLEGTTTAADEDFRNRLPPSRAAGIVNAIALDVELLLLVRLVLLLRQPL